MQFDDGQRNQYEDESELDRPHFRTGGYIMAAERRDLNNLYHHSIWGWYTQRQFLANTTDLKNKYHLAALIVFKDKFKVRYLSKMSIFCCKSVCLII
jgi:hypothetical protein